MIGQHGGVPVDVIDLDHVAVAAERLDDLWPRYAGDLGGTWLGGSESPGFRFAQVQFTNGMKVEGLEPLRPGEHDFLRRFLDASGPGPHHCTFKVPDIVAAIDSAAAHGFHAINVDLSDPDWKQAFLHPKTAGGIVIQLAQSNGDSEPEARPATVPPPRTKPATLDRIVHLVADLDTARRLFVTVLGGIAEHGNAATGFDVRWPGGGTLTITRPTNDAETNWLGGRPGRLHHLAFTVDEPAAIEHATRRPDGHYEIAPEHNLGTRLVLRSA